LYNIFFAIFKNRKEIIILSQRFTRLWRTTRRREKAKHRIFATKTHNKPQKNVFYRVFLWVLVVKRDYFFISQRFFVIEYDHI